MPCDLSGTFFYIGRVCAEHSRNQNESLQQIIKNSDPRNSYHKTHEKVS